MDEFAPVCKFTYMQNNLHMCKFGHENGALDNFNFTSLCSTIYITVVLLL